MNIKQHIEAGRKRPNRDGSRPHARSPWLTRGMSVQEKLAFWSRRAESGCLEWTGATNEGGYGMLYVDGAALMAHKRSLEESLGRPLGEGMCACHRCDNRICIEPDHLFEGTRQQNNADMVAKGRQRAPQGENHFRAKLTDDAVRLIRSSPKPHRALAKDFAVTKGLIGQIKRGLIWRHLP